MYLTSICIYDFAFLFTAFHKSLKIKGQEYALEVVDTAGQVNKNIDIKFSAHNTFLE
jgi:hypothetical protein